MIQLAERSAWEFDTSGSGGLSLDVVCGEGGVVKLYDPPHRTNKARPPVVFHYGGIGAGLSTPGLKIPKIGGAIARQLVGKALNGAGAATSLWNEGWIYRTVAVGSRELVRSDFVGGCLLAEAGVSTPVKGRTGTVFLVGLDPAELADLISPAMMIKDVVEDAILGRGIGLAPKAVIFSWGDSRGLVAGGAAYIGYMG